MNNERIIEEYIRERAHQMFTETPDLLNHQGIIRQYLRLAYLDGAFQSSAQLTENDIDDIMFAIDKAVGESYDPKHAREWQEIEEKLLTLKSTKS